MGAEEFPVGTAVIIDADNKNTIRTQSVEGVVVKTDAEAGICVRLCISRIYQPCFWYEWNNLSKRLGADPLGELSAAGIETMLGDRSNAYPDKPLFRGCLRAWMLAKVKPPVGHPLELLIQQMSFIELLTIYADRSDKKFAEWVERYDHRPKRVPLGWSRPKLASDIRLSRPKMRRV